MSIFKRNQRLARKVVIGASLACVAVQFLRLYHKPRGDFPNHWEFGRRMAAGEFIYRDGLNVPYLPFWSLAHVPFSLLPPHTAQLVLFPLFLIALWLLLWTLNRLTHENLPLPEATVFWASAGAVLLTGRYLYRDMVECGVNLALVALTWLAIALWSRRREWFGGVCLGLAGSLKCTPLAFLGYFLWKRQWKMALATIAATCVFTLSPVFLMGPTQYGQAMSVWLTYASRGLSERDPTRGVLGEEKVQNTSLRPALARLLVRVPEGHRSHIPHPLSVELLELHPETAGAIIKAVMIVFALWVAFQFRRPVRRRDDMATLWECATISLAILLYSPITWTQHCVGVLPAFYLLVRSVLAKQRLPAATWSVVGVYVLVVLILNRSLIGRELTLVLHSYDVYTWCLLALLIVALHCCSTWRFPEGERSRTGPQAAFSKPHGLERNAKDNRGCVQEIL